MVAQNWLWIGFFVLVFSLLAIDLGLLNRRAHAIRPKEAALWSAAWIGISLLFNLGILLFRGQQPALEFLTGYLIEYALSVDNIFVFVLIFSYFRVPAQYQHRVLFWGILGALIMRGAMIGAGSYLIHRFGWIIYVFGAFLVFTGIRMAFQDEPDIEPESNPVLKLLRRFIPITAIYHGQKFFVREPRGGPDMLRTVATPLFVVLVLVETTDLIFAVDSIPAIFAITTDVFIVFTSNIFAILGLRSLYFLVADIVHRFRFLQLGLSIILVFVGAKMLVSAFVHVPIWLSLLIVAAVLTGSVVLSLMIPEKRQESPLDELDLGEEPWTSEFRHPPRRRGRRVPPGTER